MLTPDPNHKVRALTTAALLATLSLLPAACSSRTLSLPVPSRDDEFVTWTTHYSFSSWHPSTVRLTGAVSAEVELDRPLDPDALSHVFGGEFSQKVASHYTPGNKDDFQWNIIGDGGGHGRTRTECWASAKENYIEVLQAMISATTNRHIIRGLLLPSSPQKAPLDVHAMLGYTPARGASYGEGSSCADTMRSAVLLPTQAHSPRPPHRLSPEKVGQPLKKTKNLFPTTTISETYPLRHKSGKLAI